MTLNRLNRNLTVAKGEQMKTLNPPTNMLTVKNLVLQNHGEQCHIIKQDHLQLIVITATTQISVHEPFASPLEKNGFPHRFLCVTATSPKG